MLQWTLTLADPYGFVQAVDLNSFTDNGYQQNILYPEIINSNNAGVPIFAGAFGNYQITWLLSLSLPTDTALRLKNLFRLQFERGYLILEDQFQELPPEPAPHSRKLIAGTERTIEGNTTGCGRIPVGMSIKPDASGQHIGMRGSQSYQDIYITLVENRTIKL